MKLTKKHREALEQAKVDLRTTDIEYICYALHDGRVLTYNQATTLQLSVQKTIKPYISVETWLYFKHYDFFNELIKKFGSKKQALIEYRCAWIDDILNRGFI